MCHLKALNCEGKVSRWSWSYQAKGSFGLFCLPALGMPAMTPILTAPELNSNGLTLNAFGIDTDADAKNRNTKHRNQP